MADTMQPQQSLIPSTAPALQSPALASAVLPEAAVAICINGACQAVMMVTPRDLEDFAGGFVLSEGLVAQRDQLLDIQVEQLDEGWQVDLRVIAVAEQRLKQRRRTMAGPSGCGLCGLNSLQQAMTLPVNEATGKAVKSAPSTAAIIQAKHQLLHWQDAHDGQVYLTTAILPIEEMRSLWLRPKALLISPLRSANPSLSGSIPPACTSGPTLLKNI